MVGHHELAAEFGGLGLGDLPPVAGIVHALRDLLRIELPERSADEIVFAHVRLLVRRRDGPQALDRLAEDPDGLVHLVLGREARKLSRIPVWESRARPRWRR